jgi:hypothetical protein
MLWIILSPMKTQLRRRLALQVVTLNRHGLEEIPQCSGLPGSFLNALILIKAWLHFMRLVCPPFLEQGGSIA